MKILKEPNILQTIFKDLHWKLVGGTVRAYWWNGPLKQNIIFGNSVVQRRPAPMQQNSRKKSPVVEWKSELQQKQLVPNKS